ncbi:MAG: hypothetical protein HHJ09_12915 [Glaciimonas sp.]|nr:hypothetical protein [Glaciimonas sp.]
MSTIGGSLVGQVVAIDGKTMRGTYHHRLGKKAIVAQGAHYVLALKGNHGNLPEQAGEFFEIAEQHKYQALEAPLDDTCEKDHGRIESRRVMALSSEHLEQVGAWQGLKSTIEKLTRVQTPSFRAVSDERAIRREGIQTSPDSVYCHAAGRFN